MANNRPQGIVALPSVDPHRPHPGRIDAVRYHLIDRGLTDDKPVAAVVLTLGLSGRIQSTSIGVEPEHVDSLVDALRTTLTQLEDQRGRRRLAIVRPLRG